MFEGPENVLYSIFIKPETKPIVEASGHISKKQKSQDGLTANFYVLKFVK